MPRSDGNIRRGRFGNFGFARLGDVSRGLPEGRVEHGAVLIELRHRAIAVPQQQKERGRVHSLQTLFHVLRGDHRIVIVRNDAPGHFTQLAQTQGAPHA